MTGAGEVRGWGTSRRAPASIGPDAVVDALAVIGADVAGIAFMAWDVSERSQQAALLGLGAERLRRFVAHSSEVVITLEEGQTIGFASAAVERVLGTPPADLTGTALLDLLHS